ncbi:hypothetical protein [Alteribacillus iranensis]|uniref:Thioredoxin n=1 Tax=Alteribacillus iranensis TaxID=930128 RepID=A0A1I2BDV8_9BACI|nr:hypothetical protein [Alteribacillus iranensis]SFE54351.1 hypothetical protein SAMN05192532_102249 [Alteribacillus iranensis]
MLQSETFEFPDIAEVNEDYMAKGWTDGLPIIPPTPEKVQQMLDFSGLSPDFVIGGIPERQKVFTAEKVAINAVMAGCLPDYFPVLVAALTAMSDEKFNLHGPTASTHGPGILVIVNGPVVEQLGLNNGQSVFGPGHRANATIGRAIRLVLHNLGGCRDFDRATLGHPGKFSFCIAEKETEWTPFHVEKGFEAEESTVTVIAAEGPNQIQNHSAIKAEGMLMTMADRMSAVGTFNMINDQQFTVVLCPEHYRTCQDQGWNKQRIREFLFEHAKRSTADLKKFGMLPGDITAEDEETFHTAVPSPDDIVLIVAGGEAGRFSACMPGWGKKQQTQAITRSIKSCTGGG